jgi:hypothetical protein
MGTLIRSDIYRYMNVLTALGRLLPPLTFTKAKVDEVLQEVERLFQTKSTRMLLSYTNDYCQGCGDGGPLVVCSYCPLVWHVDCLPRGFPPGEPEPWRCPDCVWYNNKVKPIRGIPAPKKQQSVARMVASLPEGPKKNKKR